MTKHFARVPASGTDRGKNVTKHSRLQHYFEATCRRSPERTALVVQGTGVTYAELDALANRLARHLQLLGVRPGVRCGLRLSRSLHQYVGMLAILKVGAAFVPIEPTCPSERLRYIVEDAGLALLLSTSDLAPREDLGACVVVELDRSTPRSAPSSEDAPAVMGDPDGDACYVLYTSGSAGRPKGVEVGHSSMCNFLDVIPGLYGIHEDDRVYQGMTIAFDFALEEIWPAWCVGATVVAGPVDSGGIGPALGEFLASAEITVLCCVPTVLAIVDQELPSVRTLILGGEACPAELVARWSRPWRRILNTYGPTEATITATCGEMVAGRPVTTGRALTTYGVHVLDAELRPVPDRTVGEICISGPGLARGYVGAPELTSQRFVSCEIPDVDRVYRTGDLGRILPGGDVEFLGRVDSQVKVRGHRVDLQEIESVLLEDLSVRAAVVGLVHAGAAGPALAAYVTVRDSSVEDEFASRVQAHLRARLSPYMVPEFLDVVSQLPRLPSGKVDRSNLPRPRQRLGWGTLSYAPPASAAEVQMTAVWANILGVPMDRLSAEADFFLDLGGHSWLATAVISALRRSGVARTLSVSDIYEHPTVRSLTRRHEVLRQAVDGCAALPARRGGRTLQDASR